MARGRGGRGGCRAWPVLAGRGQPNSPLAVSAGSSPSGSGSVHPPRLIELSHQPPQYQPAPDQPARADRHVVLIGKGITFDSGGLSLKPNDGMKLTMKTDWRAAPPVIGAMSALARLGPGQGDRPGGGGREHAVRDGYPGGRRHHPLRRPDGRGAQHGRRGAAGPGRRARLRRRCARPRSRGGHGHADRRRAGSAGHLHRRRCSPPTTNWPRPCWTAGTASGTGVWRMPLASGYRGGLDSRSGPGANVAGAGGRAGIDQTLPCSCGVRPAAAPGRTSTSPARPGPLSDDGCNTKGATGFGARLLLRWLGG